MAMAAEEDNNSPRTRLTTLTLPLRPQRGNENSHTLTPPAYTAMPPSLLSPGIQVEFHGDGNARPAPVYPRSAPPDVQSFPSPMRHHRRTPSAHREIKETLNARSEYANEDSEGHAHRRINQYVIKEEIGHGSYGAVHLATAYDEEFAVKAFSKTRLRRQAQSDILRHGPRQLGRFPRAGFGAPDALITGFADQRAKEEKDALHLIREEVAIMKKLNHPNLVQLIEVLDDPDDDTLYMVLEMCKKGVVMKVGIGESATPYPEETCRHYFRDLILGIEYLHSQGVVHRDIKPDNLLLTEDNVLKIVDFGVSEIFERSNDMRTAKSAGSPAFLPPELCVAKHGDVSGKAADIWSMGVSLYCLRYGRIPFERGGVLDIYEAITTETPKLPPDEGPDFVDLIGRLLEKDPGRRITMEELREHPWVTKGGTDPLLSAEENCSEPVELPNPLELNHAFTRRMTHLICVMKAIKKFKSLLRPRPQASEQDNQPYATAPAPPSPPPEHKASGEQSTAEFAARVLRERQEFLAKGQPASSSFFSSSPSNSTVPRTTTTGATTSTTTDQHHEPKQQQQQQSPALLLGIGTGGIDDFSAAEQGPAADIVSDSPTAVDFSVYDRAFEAEIERIKRSTSRRRPGAAGPGAGSAGRGGAGAGAGAVGAGPGPGPGPIYETRVREMGGRAGGGFPVLADESLRRSDPWAFAAAVAGLKKREQQQQRAGAGTGTSFAELVAKAMEEAKEGKGSGVEGGAAEDGGGGGDRLEVQVGGCGSGRKSLSE
ncbi:kinase-like protein [Parathielavia hyrcaniae]|uniref:Kinase-like protein n=1 Tax=Parathielavia hyrcaniae TaxID=113614 RepID=A0AAN6Q9F1_9PEZI|nr:kinase-like protein [Parathielavia hyrcaniae]